MYIDRNPCGDTQQARAVPDIFSAALGDGNGSGIPCGALNSIRKPPEQ